MAENYKHLYERMRKMVELYQDEIVPDLFKKIEKSVEVVRCKDCKWLYDGMDDYCCQSHRGLVRICGNSYCSYGERKENV